MCLFVKWIRVLQILFSRKLSTKQWLSLGILTAGCMIKHISFSDVSPPSASPRTSSDALIKTVDKSATSLLSLNMLFIIIQVRQQTIQQLLGLSSYIGNNNYVYKQIEWCLCDSLTVMSLHNSLNVIIFLIQYKYSGSKI